MNNKCSLNAVNKSIIKNRASVKKKKVNISTGSNVEPAFFLLLFKKMKQREMTWRAVRNS
jgi:hypothetical protein